MARAMRYVCRCLRFAVLLLAILIQGCSSRPSANLVSANNAAAVATPSMEATDEERPRQLLVEPKYESKAPGVKGTLWTIRAMPDPADVSCVLVDPWEFSRTTEMG